ncbi:hypothetical protein AOY86_15925 [Escherichia coli]|nr:hypothetical protein AOY86_15925 [Escherichia coli]
MPNKSSASAGCRARLTAIPTEHSHFIWIFSSFVARRGSENGAKTVVCHKHDGERKRMLSLLSEFSKYSLAELSYKALF